MVNPALTATVHKRVLMVDVDLVQVNFTRFFPWMDEGFNTLLHTLGMPLSQIIADGFATPVVDSRCRYLRPVTLDDRFQVVSWISRTGTSSFDVHHRFEDTRGLFAEGRCTHVWVQTTPEQRAIALPRFLTEAVQPAPPETGAAQE